MVNFRTVSVFLFIACLFPFVSFYPLASDVQPTAFIFALLIIVLKAFLDDFKINKYKLIIFCYICFLSLRISFDGLDSNELSKIIAMHVAFFTYWGLTYLRFELLRNILPCSIAVYFILSCLMFIYPSELIAMQNYIIRNTNSTVLGYRGVSTLATEPGLLAGLIVGFLAVLDHLKRNELISRNLFLLTWLMAFIVILMTKSGTGFAYLLLYLIVRNVASIGVRTIFAILAVLFIFWCVLFIISIGNYQSDLEGFGRAGSVMYKLATSPQELTGDRSIFYRLYAVYVGFLCLIEYPLGVGFGAVEQVSNILILQKPFLNNFYSSYGETFHAVSSFGYYVSALGFLFLVPFLLFIFLSNVRFDYKILVIIYIMFSYSIAFPIIWILIVFGLQPCKKNSEYS